MVSQRDTHDYFWLITPLNANFKILAEVLAKRLSETLLVIGREFEEVYI